MSGNHGAEIHACRLTPPLRSAVAVIAVRGANVAQRIAPLLAAVSGRPLDQTPLSRVALGRWRDGGEELLACRLSETELEIHCHGGAAAAERVLESLRDASVVVVDEADWTPAPGASFAVAEAARQLPRATTPRTAGVLLDQLRGAWDREADEIQQLLNDDPAAAVARIEQLEMHRSLGRHLTQPFKVALCGAPNAGKSTLLNCMAGFSRSIVWDQPGTTRDAVAADIAIDGWPVRLIDTAGIRETGDALERQGAERARQAAGEADLIVEVFDATAPAAPMFPPPALQVHNKVDLLGEPGSPVGNGEPVFVSALTGDGIDVLLDAIRQRLVSYSPPAGAAVPFHLQLLDELAAWRRRAEQP